MMTPAPATKLTMTPQEAWLCAQSQLSLQLDRPSYDAYIARVQVLSYDATSAQLVMGATSGKHLEMLQHRYARNIKRAMSDVLRQDNLTVTYQQVEQPPAPAPFHDPDDIPLFLYLSDTPVGAQRVAPLQGSVAPTSSWIKPIPPVNLTPPAWIGTPPPVAPESPALPAPSTWEQAITQAATQAGIKSYDPVAWACNRLAGSAGPILRYLLYRWNIRPSWKASKAQLEQETGITPTKAMLNRLRAVGVVVVKTKDCNLYTHSDEVETSLRDLFLGHFQAPDVLKRHVREVETSPRNLIDIDRLPGRLFTDQNLSLEQQLINLGVNAQRAKVFVMSIPPHEITAIIARAGQQTGVERIGGYLYASLNNAMKAQQRKSA